MTSVQCKKNMSCVEHGARTLLCPECGSDMLALGHSKKTKEEQQEQGAEQQQLPASPMKRKAEGLPEKSPVARKPRLEPCATQQASVQIEVRVKMIACIPGFNHKKAKAVVDYFPHGMLGDIMDAGDEELACIPVGKSSLLGLELAKALSRVVQ